ncbi:unnamed protein product [Toxocara canis]|uniref:RNA-directed DNA polymerase n=1 Tax=Toxocara canis TaxID=6265 RepID=A0A183U4D9_TOXCA|nr:unnamed protein product [Toxocara canis]
MPLTHTTLRAATGKDEILQAAISYTSTSWPDIKHLRKLPTWSELELHHRSRNVLTVEQECLMFADRMTIPQTLRFKFLRALHRGHPGTTRMKSLARSYVYWPHLDRDLEALASQCSACALVAKNPVKAGLHSWPKTTKPWQRIHVDYAGPFMGHNFLVVVDAYSKFPEIFRMASTTSLATIRTLRRLFARYGLPETFVSDSGTQFSSYDFQQFCISNGICHIFSPPYHPQSNGLAERFVDTFKRAMLKLKRDGIMDTFLGTYRTTPNASLPEHRTPAELFLGRSPRTSLDLLKPLPVQPLKRDSKMEQQFNCHHGARSRQFEIGDTIHARHRRGQNWRARTIKERIGGKLYQVQMADGAIARFHVNQLRKRVSFEGQQNHMEHQWITLLDTFGLPNLATAAETTPAKAPPQQTQQQPPERPEMSNTACSPLRRSTRPKATPAMLEVDPRRERYH